MPNSIAAIPMVAELRAEHAAALVRPMVGCPWAGEPRIERGRRRRVEAPSWFDCWVASYAAALLRKHQPDFAIGDLSHLRVRFEPPATAVFVTDVRCRCSRLHPDRLKTIAVAEVVLPQHVSGFDPRALPSSARTLPREVPRLAPSFPRHLEPPPMQSTTDNHPSRGRTVAARARGRRS